MADSLILRPLNPDTEQDLFELAYSWRTRKRHTQPDRLPFEAFAANDPTQIVMGLFNGELQAVYLFKEWMKDHLEGHFTSKRGVSRNNVVAGAKYLLGFLLDNGAVEVSALVRPKNTPIRRFVEEIGFKRQGLCLFSCTEDIDTCTMQTAFIKYVCTKGN